MFRCQLFMASVDFSESDFWLQTVVHLIETERVGERTIFRFNSVIQ